MDHPFRNRPPNRPSDFQTSATQQQEPSQATAGAPAYPLVHPGLQGLNSFSYELQESAFNPMQMPTHAQPSSVPSAVSFAPMLQGSLQVWAQEPDPYGIPAGGQAAFPQSFPVAAPPASTGAMPVYGFQGFVADPGQTPQAHAVAQPSVMQPQADYHDPHFWDASPSILNQQAAYGMQAPHPFAQPGGPSTGPGPALGKRPLADAEATDPRRTKRPSMGEPAATASLYDRSAGMEQDARLPGMATTAWSPLQDNPGAASNASGPGEKKLGRVEIGKLAQEYLANAPQSSYQFRSKSAMKDCYQRNKEVMNAMGVHYSHLVNEVLLACEKELGKKPEKDKEYNLRITLNGYQASVFWKIEDNQTALLLMTEDAQQLQKRVKKTKERKAGQHQSVLAKAGVIAKLNPNSIETNKVRSGNIPILRELGYEDQEHANALRTLSIRCDSILGAAQRGIGTAQHGDSVSGTVIPGVQRFKLTRFGPQGKAVQCLRRVEDNDLRTLVLFKDAELDDVLKEMRLSISISQSQREAHQAKASLPAQAPAIDNGVDPGTLKRLSTRHKDVLRAMGWTNVREAMSTLADLCETTVHNPQNGNSVSDVTGLPGVKHFRFPHGTPEGKAVEVLRWQFDGKVREVRPFNGGELKEALEKIGSTIHHSLSSQGITWVVPPTQGGPSA